MAKPIEFSKTDQVLLKTYFSSLSARKASYLFLGVTKIDHTYILTNMEPAALVKFCDAQFGLMVLTLKSKQARLAFHRLLRWLKPPNSDTPYVLKTPTILSALNKVKWDVTKIDIKVSKDNVMYIEKPNKKDPEVPNKVILGFPNYNFIATKALHTATKLYCQITEEEIYKKDEFIITEYDTDKLKTSKGVIDEVFSVDQYGLPDSESRMNKFRLSLIDGTETLSYREFIKKLKPGSFKYWLVTWMSGGCIEYGMLYSDKDIEVRVTRPHIRIYASVLSYQQRPINPKRKKRK